MTEDDNQSHKKNRKAYHKRYYQLHKKNKNIQHKRYYQLHKNEIDARHKRYCQSHREEINAHQNHSRKQRTEFLKHKLFDILGGSEIPKCVKCGFTDIRALQFDHINGGGTKESKIRCGYMFYKYYYQNPDLAKQKLQVLCANCNWMKRQE